MKKLSLHFCIAAIISVLTLMGLTSGLQKVLLEFRFKTVEHTPTGQVALIAIDAKSLREINTWPWPRHFHAELIDKLQSLGVTDIAFDIDFSAETTSRDDTALTNALKRADGSVILPAFKQFQVTDNNKTIIHTTPLKVFQEHAWLASVNIIPGRNGHVETMAYGHMIANDFVPTLAAMLSGRHEPNRQNFHINFSINSKSIPTYSYADILKGRIKPEKLNGRKVIIGATATELGDNLFVPAQGLISGPALQALATETLLQNRELIKIDLWVTLIVALMMAALITWKPIRKFISSRLEIFILAAIFIEAVALTLQNYAGIILPTAIWHLTLLCYGVALLLDEVNITRWLQKITRIKLENTETMFQQVFNDSFSSTLIVNRNGVIEAANKGAAEVLNLDEKTRLEGLNIKSCLPDEMLNAAMELLKVARSDPQTRHVSGQATLERKSEQPNILDYHITISSMQGAGNSGHGEFIISITFQDVTAEYYAEKAKEQATIAALEANKAKTEFLGRISHELRTPLNAIIGFSNIIETRAKASNELQDYSDFAGEIKGNGEQLLKIVNDILFLTKIESGSLPFNDAICDPLEMVEQAIEICSSLYKEADLNIISENHDHLPMLKADFQLATDALTEIISNAIKFSPEGAEILIRSELDEQENLLISVIDQGPGIPLEEIKSIFAPFYQIDGSLQRNFEGTGLGLTKAKAFMKMHQGSIDLECTPGNGTKFHINFPSKRIIRPAGNNQPADQKNNTIQLSA